MAIDVLQLQFHGPYCFSGSKDESVLNNSMGEEKGVYLWAIPFQNSYLTYYVGETGVSFAVRSMQHLQNYLNGLYRVFDPQDFSRGKKTLIWGGMWKPGRKGPETMYEFLKSYVKLAPLIIDFIQEFRLFLAPVKSSRRIRQRIEAAIAASLNNQAGMVGMFQDKDVRYSPRRSREEPIKVKIRFPSSIMGLNAEIEI